MASSTPWPVRVLDTTFGRVARPLEGDAVGGGVLGGLRGCGLNNRGIV